MKCAIAECGNEAVWSGRGRKSKYCSDACKQESYRNRKSEKRNRKLKEQRSKLYIISCDLGTANAFVSLFHRHHKAVPGSKFNLAVVDETGLMRGVAIVGRPVARKLDDGSVLEVNRVATDGCPNACSALYGATRKAAFALGYQMLITYTLVDEGGSSMRGAGWRKVLETKGSDGWLNRPGRANNTVYQSNKYRWETINPEYQRDKQRPTRIILPKEMKVSSEQQPQLWTGSEVV